MKFLKMKYEQFMMRLFYKILKIMQNNENLKWYPDYLIAQKYLDKIDELDEYCNTLKEINYNLIEKCSNLQEMNKK